MAERSAHVAVSLSCVDIMAALYFGVMKFAGSPSEENCGDAFVLSKAHAAMGYYAVLTRAGLISRDDLKNYARDNSFLAEHPLANKIPGVPFAGGSLGHGCAVAAGIAKGFKLRGKDARVFVLMGDGECDEGTVWETAAAARAQGLDNLTAIVDRNDLQACGACHDISKGVSLPDCWRAFGWDVHELDGHDFDALQKAFSAPNKTGAPRAMICRTIKGKGVSFMEGNLEWHYRPVRGADREAALRCLEDA
jgi:transketolase